MRTPFGQVATAPVGQPRVVVADAPLQVVVVPGGAASNAAPCDVSIMQPMLGSDRHFPPVGTAAHAEKRVGPPYAGRSNCRCKAAGSAPRGPGNCPGSTIVRHSRAGPGKHSPR